MTSKVLRRLLKTRTEKGTILTATAQVESAAHPAAAAVVVVVATAAAAAAAGAAEAVVVAAAADQAANHAAVVRGLLVPKVALVTLAVLRARDLEALGSGRPAYPYHFQATIIMRIKTLLRFKMR